MFFSVQLEAFLKLLLCSQAKPGVFPTATQVILYFPCVLEGRRCLKPNKPEIYLLVVLSADVATFHLVPHQKPCLAPRSSSRASLVMPAARSLGQVECRLEAVGAKKKKEVGYRPRREGTPPY